MTPAVLLPAESTNKGYAVWEVHGAPSPNGPWRKANAGASGRPVQARFADNETHWRIVWVAHSGGTLPGQPTPLPWAQSAPASGSRRVPGRDF